MKLPRVPSSEEILDRAFKRSLKVMSNQTIKAERAREEETGKVNALSDTTSDALLKVQKSFPTVENLHPFYRAVVNIEIGTDKIRQDLSRVQWAAGKIMALANEARRKIKSAQTPKEMTSARKAYSGRLGSLLGRVKNPLKRLERVRLLLKDLPYLSPEELTVVISGVPNVGKSRLVKALSTADPQVAVYPFTTKGVTIGHMDFFETRVQIMDIPGLLDRPSTERNDIELKGVAALKEAADMVVFIFDPSLTCGYDMKKQQNLREEIARITPAEIIDVSNKCDVSTTPVEGTLPISAETGAGLDELKRLLEKKALEHSNRKEYYTPVT
ncbi:MAG TPA: GTPase [Euryarchaeota archaeon]|nr:GTPase [Euryarchaeota archaeon]